MSILPITWCINSRSPDRLESLILFKHQLTLLLAKGVLELLKTLLQRPNDSHFLFPLTVQLARIMDVT